MTKVMIKSPLRLTIRFHAFLIGISLLVYTPINAQQDSLNATLIGHLPYAQWNLSDIWGYVDSAGNEYALVSLQDGLDVVDITNPANPQSVLRAFGPFSIWRDVKTWDHCAYVSHDFQFSWSTLPNDGIMIIDLDSLSQPRIKRFRPTFIETDGGLDSLQTAHNVFVDENGVLYVFGSNINTGGALMFDVATDPWNPSFLGSFETFYLHDGYVRNDTLYGAAVNNGLLCIVDVSNKANPQLLTSKTTPNQLTHNCWLSDDGRTVYTTDEVFGGFIAAYDIQDLNNVTEVDRIRTLPGTNVVPHNVHVYGDYLVTSYYTRGLHIIDAQYPENMIEVGWYDTSPQSGGGFDGAWGAYPYLPSGNVLVSDIQEGLFIVDVEYTPGSRMYCLLVDSITGNPVFGAELDLFNRNLSKISNFNGAAWFGVPDQGWDAVEVKAAGYYPEVVNFQFIQGNYDTLRIPLLPLNFGLKEQHLSGFELYPNPSRHYFEVTFRNQQVSEVSIGVADLTGRLMFEKKYQNTGKIRVEHALPAGMYLVHVKQGESGRVERLCIE
jgi:choice-of-anchor B domain-containing protein